MHTVLGILYQDSTGPIRDIGTKHSDQDGGRSHVQTWDFVAKDVVLFPVTMMNERGKLSHPHCRTAPAAPPQHLVLVNASFANPRRNTRKFPKSSTNTNTDEFKTRLVTLKDGSN